MLAGASGLTSPRPSAPTPVGLAAPASGTTPGTTPGRSGGPPAAPGVRPAAVTPSLSLTPVPASLLVRPGDAASIGLTLQRTGVSGAVTLSVSGLPSRTTATFSPDRLTGGTLASTLVLQTSDRSPEGRSTLTVQASSGSVSTTTTVVLVVERPGVPFTLDGPTGGATGLAPGVSVPLNLRIGNPNSTDLTVGSLSVWVLSTTSPGCLPANYRVTQLTGRVVVPAGARRTLRQLGVATAALPRLEMLNLPTNQDACKGATVRLSYSAAGQGGVTP